MADHPQHSQRNLPNTPRVGEKILAYYQLFGQDRDLEKFMRLYSPVSSEDCKKAIDDKCISFNSYCERKRNRETVDTTNSFETLVTMSSKPFSASVVHNSKSLPNIDVKANTSTENEYLTSNELVIDINIETESEKEKVMSISTENLKTPKKTFKNTKTQTPESVAKTHRRLEWDSLGDVGYKKAMSTSNISTIERSMLRGLFKENSVVLVPNTSAPALESESSITNDDGVLKEKLKTNQAEYSTPPLASSTLVTPSRNGAKPKTMSQYTSSTSLNEKFEKYAQTSFVKPSTVRSQEIQCTISSSSSIMESTTTPSSFEYHSSKSRSSKSSDNLIKNTISQKQLKPLEHSFITSVTDLLMKPKTFGEKNQKKRHHNILEIQAKIEAALNENKENHSHSTVETSTVSSFSLSKAPELDLGIQLICSLIDAKHINGRQKKQLIRDIIKRITCLEAGNEISNLNTVNGSSCASGNYNNYHHQHVYDSVRSNTDRKSLKLGQPQEKSKPSSADANDNFSEILPAEEIKKHFTTQSHHFQQSQQFPYKNFSEHSQKEINTKVSSKSADIINKDTQNDLIAMDKNKVENKKIPSNYKLTIEALIENKINHCTQTSKASVTSTSATTTPSPTTQKFIVPPNNELNNYNTDAEQPTMREWLNPLTQSEIEYEKKKQIEIKEKMAKNSKDGCGRKQQINWIENEIERLECLKYLLLKDENTVKSLTNLNNDSIQTDKLYDTVFSDKTSDLSKSAERLNQEIEIILEESHEDVIDLKNNIKRTKDRKKETHIIYEKKEDSLKNTKTNVNPKFRSINEKTNFHEEQLLKSKGRDNNTKPRQQREKIDTPSTTKSDISESLRELVQQRKQEFMETYKSKKQRHYEVLKKHQKDNFRYLNLQRKLDKKSTSTTDSEHYSLPHSQPRKYPLPSIPLEVKAKTKAHVPQREQVCRLRSADHQPNHHKVINTTSSITNNTATTCSSSMFCISSDISVPMGSQNTSSTPTTTHQYDDVAAAATATVNAIGVAVQTSDYSMLSDRCTATNLCNTTACIQVKPKGIAYVIEFDDDAILNPTSNIDIKSKDIAAKSKDSQLTNNLKPSMSSAPLLTLQQHLEKSKPIFLQNSKERKAILNQMQLLRQERDRQLRDIIESTSFNSLDRRLQHLPPPPIQKLRILKTKEMKALTNKRFTNLSEVVAKQERELEERKKRTNRILRDVFNKRLQKRVHSGKLSLNHSKNVI